MKQIIEKVMQEDYQGWDNYATWGVALILDDNQEMLEYVQEEMRRIMDGGGEEASQVTELEDVIREYVEGMTEEAQADANEMISQLISVAMAEVNWREIAKSYIDEESLQRSQK